MNLNTDLQKYRQGDRAAEMRLLSFIQELHKSGDAQMLHRLSAEGGRIGSAARNAAAKYAAEAAAQQRNTKLRHRINEHLAAAESIMLNYNEDARIRLVAILGYLSTNRWRLLPDQETYNIDLKIRQVLARARQLGIKI